MTPIADDRLPFHALVSADPTRPIDIFEQSAALHMAILERPGVSSLGTEWDGSGIYVLLDRHAPDGSWGAYVGKAPAGIRARLRNHVTNKDHWYRAVLIKRDTSHGFSSAHTGWLEGRIWQLLRDATAARLHNYQQPGDDTVLPYDLPMLEAAVDPIARLLHLLGHDTTTSADDETIETDDHTPIGTKVFHGVSLSDLIAAGLLTGDEKLQSTLSTVNATAQLQPDGRIEYSGHFYLTPSGAAIAARGNSANGWSMWAVETPNGLVRLATLRTQYMESQK